MVNSWVMPTGNGTQSIVIGDGETLDDLNDTEQWIESTHVVEVRQ